MNQAIVAVEPDTDYSEQSRRIDQGLIDASREAQNQVLEPQNKSSWWALSFGVPAVQPATSQQAQAPTLSQVTTIPSSSINPASVETGGNSAATSSKVQVHRRTCSGTVSYNKTFRVP